MVGRADLPGFGSNLGDFFESSLLREEGMQEAVLPNVTIRICCHSRLAILKRDNPAERLGFLGRLIHGHIPRAWIEELRTRLEPADDADGSR
jgi:hypothetical protein